MTIKSINWHYRVTLPEQNQAPTPIQGDSLRVILFVDHQCNGATAAVLDILDVATIHEFRNLVNVGRFDILLDKTHVINYRTLASDATAKYDQGFVLEEYKFYKKVSIPIEFNAQAGAITEISSNNVGVLLISTNGLCGFASKFRIRFSDAGYPCY